MNRLSARIMIYENAGCDEMAAIYKAIRDACRR